jgi:gluconate transporter
MPLLLIFLNILILLVLILKKVNPFIALLIVSITLGVMFKMPLPLISEAIKEGIGSTLGSIALVIALGAMFGKVIEVSGAAQQITMGLVRKFGVKYIQWAVMLTGLIVGIPMFYNAGFILLLPLIFAIAYETKLSIIFVGIPMAASLSVTHGFLPPHPGPTAIAGIFKADLGLTLLYGLIISIPAIILAGPVFVNVIKNMKVGDQNLKQENTRDIKNKPSVILSILIALLPVIIITASVILSFAFPKLTIGFDLIKFIGEPFVALLVSLFVAIYFLQIRKGLKLTYVMSYLTDSVGTVAIIMLIIAAGGAFKQVIVAAGVGKYISDICSQMNLSPLVMGWTIAAILRVSIGSATVAGLTAAGIVSPLLQSTMVKPELMVLAIGAGSLMFSHVNDTGFWMFKEFFKISLKQTFLSWSIMETIVSLVGLFGVLILNYIV